ncbi:unnamed protein product [Lampetra fluviatilis]
MPRAKHGEKRLVALVRELDIVLPIAAGNGDYVLEGGPGNSGPRGLPALAQGVGLAVAGGGTCKHITNFEVSVWTRSEPDDFDSSDTFVWADASADHIRALRA